MIFFICTIHTSFILVYILWKDTDKYQWQKRIERIWHGYASKCKKATSSDKLKQIFPSVKIFNVSDTEYK